MKKFIALMLSVMLFPTALFSCGGDEEVSGGESSAVSEAPESEASSNLSDVPVMGDSVSEITSDITSDITSELDSSDVLEGSISIVVLGDSIARGYGLENVEAERFSSLLSEKLKKNYGEVSVANYGVDGRTGRELLESIKTDPAPELKDCDYVIISIGGNNILQALKNLENIVGMAENFDPIVFVDYFKYLFAEDAETKKKFEYTLEIINTAFGDMNEAFESEQFESIIETAGKNLEKEIPEIVNEIKKINPDVKIYIQTVYNPYDGITVSLNNIEETLDLAYHGERAVAKLNAPIESLADECGYTVVPIWRAFDESAKTLTNAGFEIMKGQFSVDPHPNSKGHAYIAEIYYTLLTEEQND